MTDKQFDKRLKEALEHLEAPYDPASWAALEQRLNAPFAEEHPAPVHTVDKAMFRTLERLEAPYQPSHWEMLANRMVETSRLRRRVWISKLSEAAIFLLLVANLDGFFGKSPVVAPQPATPVAPTMNRPQAGIPQLRTRRSGDAINSPASSYGSTLNAAEMPANVPAYAFQDFENQGIAANNLQRMSEQQIAEPIPLNPFSTTVEHWESLPDIVKLPILLGQPKQWEQNIPATHPVVQAKMPKTSRFYAATFANIDRNIVRSEDYTHTAGGYGGGMALGYRMSKWGVEAGLSYNRKHYQPKKEIEIYSGNTVNGFYGSYAKQVDADMVSVPVKVTRRIAQFGQTSVHAVAGVTTNITLDKSYHYGSVFYPGQAPPSANTDPDQQPQLRVKGRGLLENGSLQDNVYVSADAGVRLEHPVGRRFVAFVEPAYRHAIGGKGVGPKPSKISTLSVQAGVLATL